MSLVYTEGYLHYTLLTAIPEDFDFNIYNILFIPPKDTVKLNKISIYEYDIYHPLYEIYIGQEPIYISDLFFQKNMTYKISANNEIQMYYEKKEETKI